MLRVLFEIFVENSDPWGSGLYSKPRESQYLGLGPRYLWFKKKNWVFLFVYFLKNIKNNP